VKRKLCRAWLIGASIVGMLSLAGCGPGVGGTGTGAAALTAFGASAAPVCNGALAAELTCAQAPAASAAGGVGTLPVQFVDAAGQVTLDINGNLAKLEASCLRLRFDGEFGRSGGNAEGFFGSYEVDANGIDVLAALSAVPVPGGGALTIELRGVDGNAVIGPMLLRRAMVPLPAPNPC
jgi:hypothetical protein